MNQTVNTYVEFISLTSTKIHEVRNIVIYNNSVVVYNSSFTNEYHFIHTRIIVYSQKDLT